MFLHSQRKCPSCGSLSTFEGSVQSEASEDSYANKFYPRGLRLLILKRHVNLIGAYFYACTECGHVWHKLDPKDLVELIESKGSDTLKLKLRAKRRSVDGAA